MLRSSSSLALSTFILHILIDFSSGVPIDRETGFGPMRKCGVNQMQYIDEDESFSTCDCKPYHIYDSKSGMCHRVYEKGPCKNDEYLVFIDDILDSMCVKNPCKEYGEVIFGGICRGMNDFCEISQGKHGKISIDNNSLEVVCLSGHKSKRSSDKGFCPKGSRRYYQGKCPGQQKETQVKDAQNKNEKPKSF